jgi:hypothetical protein
LGIAFVAIVLSVFLPTWMTDAPIAFAAPFDLDGQDWEGLSSFVHAAESELGTQRVVTRGTLALGDLRREDGLVIVHPERSLDVDELSSFMRTGGRIVLLDDYGTGESLCARFGIRRVPMPARPAHMLRDNPSLAIAEPAGDHPTLHDVDRVVTNHATGLAHQALSPLLVVRGEREPDVLLAVAGAVGHGRLIAVGDGSIAINAMLRYPGNRAFARALVRYAVDDDVWGKRGGKLYIVANGFRTTGTFGDDTAEGGALGSLRRSIVEALETVRHEGAPPVVSYFAALALALGIIVWTSTRVGRVHKPLAPHFVRPVPPALQGGVAGHAAVLGSPEGSRAQAMVEWKSAIEEHLATRLGLDRAPALEELVAQVRAAGLLDEKRAASLSRLLVDLARVETVLARPTRQAGWTDRVGDARLVAVANQARELLSFLESAPPQAGGGLHRPRAW